MEIILKIISHHKSMLFTHAILDLVNLKILNQTFIHLMYILD